MPRTAYQRDHYDVSLYKKSLAIEKGAHVIGTRELAAMVYLARNGQPMGRPETAVMRMRAYRYQGKQSVELAATSTE